MPLDIMSDALFIYPSLNIGQMITDNDKGTFFGAGVGAEVRSAYDVSFFIEGEFIGKMTISLVRKVRLKNMKDPGSLSHD